MLEHIDDNKTAKVPTVEEMRRNIDEMMELFDAARERIDTIIERLDQVLLYEERYPCDETDCGVQ